MSRVAFTCLLLASAAGAAPDRAKEIDDYLTRCERFGFSGSVLVVRAGKTLLQRGYGLADREKGVLASADTTYEIASATKTFTACAVMKLVEAGKLSLDDPIAKHLPGVPEARGDITVRHLLAHTSGMPRSATGGRGSNLRAAVAGYLAAPPVREPGAAFEYWNGGYALLAGIVEHVSGMSYMAFCRENLFRPAGLENTGFTGDDFLRNQAIGYDGAGAVRPAAGHPYGEYGWQYRGMGGIVTSVADLKRFLDAYEAGKVVSEGNRRLMETEVTEYYGLGWGIAATKRKTRRIGHGGDVRCFHTSIERFPDERALVIVLTNVDAIEAWPIGWNVEALLFGETPPYPVPPSLVDVDGKALDALAGAYAIDDANRIDVARSGGGLLVTGTGPRASAALAGSEGADLSREIAVAERVVAAVRARDPAPIAAVLADRVPKSWPGHLVNIIWPGHLERWGELKGVRTLGATAPSKGYVRVLVELEHERGKTLLEVAFEQGKLGIFRLDAQRFLGGTVYQPTAPGRFAAFPWKGPQCPPLRFDGKDLVLAGGVRAARIEAR
ncbi:MAG TPA: serine hydrolase domain-containing protein [Planctomycetota bacterium]|nr:serine hydrolase domain-containing protein [Planctomycetota bacterium]